MRYTTKRDVIDSLPDDVTAEEYDVEAIVDRAYVYRVDKDGDGNELLNTAGFEQIVDVDEFWRIIEECGK